MVEQQHHVRTTVTMATTMHTCREGTVVCGSHLHCMGTCLQSITGDQIISHYQLILAIAGSNGTMFTGLAVGDHQLTLNCCSVMARRSCATQQVDIEVKPATIIQFNGKVTVRGSDVVVEFNSSRSNATYRCRLLKEGVVVVDWELCKYMTYSLPYLHLLHHSSFPFHNQCCTYVVIIPCLHAIFHSSLTADRYTALT